MACRLFAFAATAAAALAAVAASGVVSSRAALGSPSGLVAPLAVVSVPTPRFDVPHYDTKGVYPNVSGRPGLAKVNAGLRRAILRDQASYEPSARKQVGFGHGSGLYQTSLDRRLVSASTVVVSALIPALKLYPGGNDGQVWIATTVLVPSGKHVSLTQLLADPRRALPVIARAWKKQARAEGLRPVIAAYPTDFTPTLRHYHAFALTLRGVAFGLPMEPAGSRMQAVVPYSVVRPYLSPLGRHLVSGVRRAK